MAQESDAFQFWSELCANRTASRPVLTKTQIAQEFKMQPQRLAKIIANPAKIGNSSGPPPRLPKEEEDVIVYWVVQRSQAHIHTSMEDIIAKANDIMIKKSVWFWRAHKAWTLNKRLVL